MGLLELKVKGVVAVGVGRFVVGGDCCTIEEIDLRSTVEDIDSVETLLEVIPSPDPIWSAVAVTLELETIAVYSASQTR